MALVEYDDHEMWVECAELWALLRRHGFVEGNYCSCSPETYGRFARMAADMEEALASSEAKRFRGEVT